MKKVMFFLFFFGFCSQLIFAEGRLFISSTGKPLILMDTSYRDRGITVDDQIGSFPDSVIFKALIHPGNIFRFTAQSFFTRMDGLHAKFRDEYTGVVFNNRHLYFVNYHCDYYKPAPWGLIFTLISSVLMIALLLWRKGVPNFSAILSAACILLSMFMFSPYFSVENPPYFLLVGLVATVSAVLVGVLEHKIWPKIYFLAIAAYILTVYLY